MRYSEWHCGVNLFLMEKPYSSSCERNAKPIRDVLKKVIRNNHKNLLELGSGTGQHAVYIAPQFPKIIWTTSDVKSNHGGINLWLSDANVQNVKGPLELEIGKDNFPDGNFDVVYTANTFHIMDWEKDKSFMQLCRNNLKEGALVIIYGPFNYNRAYTSQSNADFDIWLKERDPLSAIRSFEDVNESMSSSGFTLLHDFEMPANNRTLCFKKT